MSIFGELGTKDLGASRRGSFWREEMPIMSLDKEDGKNVRSKYTQREKKKRDVKAEGEGCKKKRKKETVRIAGLSPYRGFGTGSQQRGKREEGLRRGVGKEKWNERSNFEKRKISRIRGIGSTKGQSAIGNRKGAWAETQKSTGKKEFWGDEGEQKERLRHPKKSLNSSQSNMIAQKGAPRKRQSPEGESEGNRSCKNRRPVPSPGKSRR